MYAWEFLQVIGKGKGKGKGFFLQILIYSITKENCLFRVLIISC